MVILKIWITELCRSSKRWHILLDNIKTSLLLIPTTNSLEKFVVSIRRLRAHNVGYIFSNYGLEDPILLLAWNSHSGFPWNNKFTSFLRKYLTSSRVSITIVCLSFFQVKMLFMKKQVASSANNSIIQVFFLETWQYFSL